MVAHRTHTRAPLENKTRYTLMSTVSGSIRRPRHSLRQTQPPPRARVLFLKYPPASYEACSFLWCCVLCARAAAGAFVSGGSLRTMCTCLWGLRGWFYRLIVSYCIVSKYRIGTNFDTPYDTIFRYDISELSIRYPTILAIRSDAGSSFGAKQKLLHLHTYMTLFRSKNK